MLNFERHKWGGVRHLDPVFIAFDLSQFALEAQHAPLAADMAAMSRILEIVSGSEPATRVNELEKQLAGTIPSNKNERRTLIGILAYCGILQAAGHRGFFSGFVRDSDRMLPPTRKNDWPYPACWWRGLDGVNSVAVSHYFPELQWKTDHLH